MEHKIFHLHALSALHVGTGQSVGVVDLPIARARATNLPLVPGSGLKGVLREAFSDSETLTRERHKTLFGPESNASEDTHAGALAVGDAHLLLLPVRSFNGIVAFATCPFILDRYARDLQIAAERLVLCDEQAALPEGSGLATGGKVLLEDLDLNVLSNNRVADDWADRIAGKLYPGTDADDSHWRDTFKKHFAILPDAVFSFLADTATEVRARIRIEQETRTVREGALWYEENLPAESVLWGIIGISRSRNTKDGASAAELAACLPTQEMSLQIGGKHTVGRGLCRLLMA